MLKYAVPVYLQWVDFSGPYIHAFSGGRDYWMTKDCTFRTATLINNHGVTVLEIKHMQHCFHPWLRCNMACNYTTELHRKRQLKPKSSVGMVPGPGRDLVNRAQTSATKRATDQMVWAIARQCFAVSWLHWASYSGHRLKFPRLCCR